MQRNTIETIFLEISREKIFVEVRKNLEKINRKTGGIFGCGFIKCLGKWDGTIYEIFVLVYCERKIGWYAYYHVHYAGGRENKFGEAIPERV